MRTARFSQLAMSQSREYVRISGAPAVSEFSWPKLKQACRFTYNLGRAGHDVHQQIVITMIGIPHWYPYSVPESYAYQNTLTS